MVTLRITITEAAQMTLDYIRRAGESEEATIVRILETLASTAESFDEFYGPPEDGKGPSGE